MPEDSDPQLRKRGSERKQMQIKVSKVDDRHSSWLNPLTPLSYTNTLALLRPDLTTWVEVIPHMGHECGTEC